MSRSVAAIRIDPLVKPLAANVTVLSVLMTLLALGGSPRKVEHLAHGTVSIAGVAFAIEKPAAAYEQRMTLLLTTAVLIAG